MKYDLSILIPARNEMFTARTVQDIIEKKRGNTEVIVGMDGQWSDPGIPDHPDVRIIYVSQAIGQRAMTNRLARLSKAKYLMKVDAHCTFDEGFDVKLMADMQDDWTVVPVMKNLHAFDWVCPDGHRRYQGPSGPCHECGKETVRDILWRAKPSPNSTSYRFDKTLKFQYFGEYKKVQDQQNTHLVESMSLQGSCFMLTRDKYWQLEICDEKAGSWGHQGSEVALKTWLSGGRVVVNKKTWYAHMFRTQGGDFGFPWPARESEIEQTRQHFRDIFLEDRWPKAKRQLNWLVDKFAPVPDWHDQTEPLQPSQLAPAPEALSNKGIIFYTDNRLRLKIAHRVQRQLRNISREKNIPIVSASLKPMSNMGKNTHIKAKPGRMTYFKQIIAALEASTAEIVFFCEHDVLYHPSHFDFTPPRKDKFYYNLNVWRVRTTDGKAVTWEANQVAELCCYRQHALDYYRARIKEISKDGFNRSYEPGGRNKSQYEQWWSEYPNIDIRHGANLSYSKWSPKDFRDKSTCVNWQESSVDKIPGWDGLAEWVAGLAEQPKVLEPS